MRIAYVYLGADLDHTVGVTRKVIDQLQAWHRSGHDIRLFAQTHSRPGLSQRLFDEAGLPTVLFEDHRVAGPGAFGAARRRLRTVRALVDAVRSWVPTLVYLRFTVGYGPLVRLARDVPTVLEVNSDDLVEWRHFPGYKYLYHRLTRTRLLGRAAGMVFVTHELAMRAHFHRYGKPFVVIGNGIALGKLHPRQPRARPRPRLVFVGEPGFPWHGVDKVVALARVCPDWDFSVVGYGVGHIGADMPPNVQAHGYLTPDESSVLLEDADAALGTLAFHRVGLTEACPLKVRQYLAQGVPAIIGYRDTDFPEGAWFLLQLPNREDNVRLHVGAIRQFVERVNGRRVSREEIAHLDAGSKERQRLEFFERVVRDGAGAGGAA